MGQEFVLLISSSVFCIGACGFIIRKNPLIMFMSVELMLNSVNFLLIAYSSFLNSLDGQIFALFIIYWSGRQDLNLRPSGPKPDALPGCATPRSSVL